MRVRLLCLLTLPLLASPAAAQDGRPDPAKVVAPYLDDQTIAVVQVDVRKAEPEFLLTRLRQIGMPKSTLNDFATMLQQARARFLKAGGRDLFVVVSLGSQLREEPITALLVVPAAKADNRNALATLLKEIPNIQVVVKGGVVIAGKPLRIASVGEIPRALPEIGRGFAALEKYPVRVVAVLPPALRRSLQELSPTLPKELGGGSVKAITHGLLWTAAGITLGDNTDLRVLVQAKDADAAKELTRLADAGRATLRQVAEHEKLDALADILKKLRPTVEGDRLALALDARTIDAVLLPVLARMRTAAGRQVSQNNLKQLALAMHNYHDTHTHFPPQYTTDKKKRPLLSWRVHILPYIEQQELYRKFKLDEPWDSPHNKALIAQMPPTFRTPRPGAKIPAGKTTYLVPAGPKLAFDGPKTIKITQIADGTSNTIMIVEAADDRAVFWTQPADWEVDPQDVTKGLFTKGQPGTNAAFFDGSVRFLARTIDAETLWLLLCPNDGKVIPRK